MPDPTIPEDPREMRDPPPHCKHCDQPMTQMLIPPNSSFDSPWIYVCFNDECGYYVRGWDVMAKQSMSHTSYRYKLDPFTGETGPLPVWSEDALRCNIVGVENE